jgi:hypothetical protein
MAYFICVIIRPVNTMCLSMGISSSYANMWANLLFLAYNYTGVTLAIKPINRNNLPMSENEIVLCNLLVEPSSKTSKYSVLKTSQCWVLFMFNVVTKVATVSDTEFQVTRVNSWLNALNGRDIIYLDSIRNYKRRAKLLPEVISTILTGDKIHADKSYIPTPIVRGALILPS